MIKICPVILNNEAVTVAKYGDTKIQFPSIKKDEKTVIVKHEDGKYEIIDKIPEEASVKKRVSRRKKTAESKSVTDDRIELN